MSSLSQACRMGQKYDTQIAQVKKIQYDLSKYLMRVCFFYFFWQKVPMNPGLPWNSLLKIQFESPLDAFMNAEYSTFIPLSMQFKRE